MVTFVPLYGGIGILGWVFILMLVGWFNEQ